MSQDNSTPASLLRAPRPLTAEEQEDALEAAEEAEVRAKASARGAQRSNKVAEFLGETFFRINKTWPCLYWRQAGVQTSVEMYFPRLNLAVDRFLRPTSLERQEAAFKEAKLSENGVRYVALFPEVRLAELSKYL